MAGPDRRPRHRRQSCVGRPCLVPVPYLARVLSRLGVLCAGVSPRIRRWAAVETERAFAAYAIPPCAMPPRLSLTPTQSVADQSAKKRKSKPKLRGYAKIDRRVGARQQGAPRQKRSRRRHSKGCGRVPGRTRGRVVRHRSRLPYRNSVASTWSGRTPTRCAWSWARDRYRSYCGVVQPPPGHFTSASAVRNARATTLSRISGRNGSTDRS